MTAKAKDHQDDAQDAPEDDAPEASEAEADDAPPLPAWGEGGLS